MDIASAFTQNRPVVDPNVLAQWLQGMRLGASNAGPAFTGTDLLTPAYGERTAPAFGGAMQIPGTGLSLHGQYQRYPGAPPNAGVALKYGVDF